MSGFGLSLSLPTSVRITGLRGFSAMLKRALVAIETRRDLAEMDDRMLRDVGISRADALHEAERAPWDLDITRRGQS
ncbi:DUF1127 domain-containing protein [Humitalea sp. 24SJ18S-53]|uniref:DUF1127 domain-containing protein n=1 Tax=Humitalea sp. 24SJ18S-53 TaxID=3422307 RepID=UPI003D66E76F